MPEGPGDASLGWTRNVSNIPFNTIASILQSAGVGRQAAASQAKRTQDQSHREKVFQVQNQAHAQEVQDLNEQGVDAIGDEPEKHQPGGKSKKRLVAEEPEGPAEVVDIAQLSTGTSAAKPKMPPPPRPRLDISA